MAVYRGERGAPGRPRPAVRRWVRLRSRGASPWIGITGLVALALMALLFVSGAVMSLYYSPAPGLAYDSVDYAQFEVPFGVVVRGVHVYAWNLLLVVLGLHLARLFLMAAYRAPWHFAWVSGVLVLLVLPACIVTGDLLPWTQSGYWSTRVRLGIMSSVPVVGDLLAGMLRGGSQIGIVTLARFYALHTLFLPCVLLGALTLHAYCVGRGLRDTATPEGDKEAAGLLLPLATRWLIALLIATVALGLLSWERPIPMGDPADPTDTSYVPRPEWWVLPLNQLVTMLRGPYTVVATALVPGGIVGLLLALPFIDPSPDRHPQRHGRAVWVAAGTTAVLFALAAISYVEHYVSKG